jgi:peptidyl-prolyl cis-trans isomerase SurA
MKLLMPRNRAESREQKAEKTFAYCLLPTVFSALCLLPSALSAQTLFSYGRHKVSKQEFLHAYNKNNSDSNATKISYADYLELYTKFRLKVQAALDAKMDTLTLQKTELESFRHQLSESFLKEDASINLLVDEAFERSLKDIHLSQIFIPADKGAPAEEINAARQKINAAHAQLEKGESFENVAAAYQHGSLGFITAFVLPYEFESAAYTTAGEKYSKPLQSDAGFHILIKDNERKAVGKIRIAQILLSFPPNVTADKKKELASRADSIFNALKSGADFSLLAEKLSDDHLTFQSGGEMPAFGVGLYDSLFENTAFSLEKDGAFSKPIETSFGYHILYRLQLIPVIEDKNNKDWMNVIKERVTQSDRMKVAQTLLVESIRKKIQNDAAPADMQSDSSVLEYYRDHLEHYNSDFGEQINEFKEGNLLFTIMQQNVWDAATADSAALHEYYNKNKEKYFWENSADAIIITCLDPSVTEETQSQAKEKLAQWREWSQTSNGQVQADSGRFELSQIPVAERTNFTEGLVTAPVINNQDSSRTFAAIIKLYKEKEAKNYDDAKGSVINDYQNFLEEKWIAALKKKYPVKVKKKVFKNLGQG